MRPTVSIVTITYNAEEVVEKTISSVLSQNFTDFEYVFVDGDSKDKTLEIIESFRQKFEDKGVTFCVLSEPDLGIYDAMNKSVLLAGGEWVLMLNAGDMLAHQKVLSSFFADTDYEADVIYGDTILSDSGYYKKRATYTMDIIDRQMPFCHQSVFVRTDVLRKYRFDTRYRLAADYDLFVRLYRDGMRFDYVKKLVSLYDMTGISEQNVLQTNKEADLIRQHNGLALRRTLWNDPTARSVISWMYTLKKKLFPSRYFTESNGWYPDPTILF